MDEHIGINGTTAMVIAILQMTEAPPPDIDCCKAKEMVVGKRIGLSRCVDSGFMTRAVEKWVRLKA